MRNPLFAATVVVLTCLMAVSQNTPVTQNTAAAQPKVAVQPIGEPAFTVPAGTFKDYTFAVPEGLKKVGVFGHFKATGGPHNDIVVLVMTDDQFVNWRNARDRVQNNPIKDSFRGAMYTSHLVTQGTIKQILPTDPGTYHVVFYNGFSILTPKAVEANIALQFTK